jgi:hypothetical protein
MNILTDILSLFKRKKFRNYVKPDDVIVIGINEEPEIEGIASPVPYKDVKLVKYKDFLAGTECENVNVPLGNSNAGVFRDKTTDPITGECFDNFRRLRSVGINLSIDENGDYIDFDCTAEENTASNVGGGAEVFQQKIGEDLVFRTLESQDGTITITQNTDTIDFSVADGIWSTVDAAGLVTYYSLYSDALAVASSGDTITLHTDYELSTGTGHTLKDGVNINLNGFTYTYSNTDSSSAFSDVLAPGSVDLRIYNGTVIRKDQAVTGGAFDTLALQIAQGGRIECSGVKFINLNGWGISLEGTLINAFAQGSVGGIALKQTFDLRNSYGTSGSGTGVSTEDITKQNSSVVNSVGESVSGIGISLLGANVQGCIGRSIGETEQPGVELDSCLSQNISGYSKSGSGVIVNFGKISNCTGITEASSLAISFSGVVLNNVVNSQNINGFADTSVENNRGITIISDGQGIPQIHSHLSAVATSIDSVGMEIIANNDFANNDNVMTFKNCTSSGDNIGCRLDSSNFSINEDNIITMLNCSFNSEQDAGIALESINSNGNLGYANCAFRTGNNSLGTPIVGVTQTITNTPDLQGNIYT